MTKNSKNGLKTDLQTKTGLKDYITGTAPLPPLPLKKRSGGNCPFFQHRWLSSKKYVIPGMVF